jgi:hypothetical protein
VTGTGSGGLFRRVVTRGFASAAILVIYLIGTLAVSTLAMTAGATPAQASRGRGRGRGVGRGRGRGWARGRGRGIYVGPSVCAVVRSECAALYGWRTGRWYRCVGNRGC